MIGLITNKNFVMYSDEPIEKRPYADLKAFKKQITYDPKRRRFRGKHESQISPIIKPFQPNEEILTKIFGDEY